jgi:hypothetical protein
MLTTETRGPRRYTENRVAHHNTSARSLAGRETIRTPNSSVRLRAPVTPR